MKHAKHLFLASALCATVFSPAAANAEEKSLHVPLTWRDVPRPERLDQFMKAELPNGWMAVFTRSGRDFTYALGKADGHGVLCTGGGSEGQAFGLICSENVQVGYWSLKRPAGSRDAQLDWVFDDAQPAATTGELR